MSNDDETEPIRIWMLWIKTAEDPAPWLLDAWDDDTVANDPADFNKAKQAAYANYGADVVRVVSAQLSRVIVESSFKSLDASLTNQYLIGQLLGRFA